MLRPEAESEAESRATGAVWAILQRKQVIAMRRIEPPVRGASGGFSGPGAASPGLPLGGNRAAFLLHPSKIRLIMCLIVISTYIMC